MEAALRAELGWKKPIYKISAINQGGCDDLCQQLMESIESHRQKIIDDGDYRKEQSQQEKAMAFEIRQTIESSKNNRASDDDNWEENWDD